MLPHNFHFALVENAEFWTTLNTGGGCFKLRSCHNLNGVARLKDGVTIDAALADLSRIAKDLEAQYPDSNRNQGATVAPLSEVIVGDVRPVLLLLLCGAGLLLLIACINVASLLLVRSETRRRELAVRRALGATRARLIRQFVIEGFVIVVAGSIIGLVSSHWAMQILRGLIPADMMSGMPYLNDLGLNSRVLMFALALAGFAVALFALTPSLRLSTVDVREGMSEGSRGSAGRVWTRIGSKLVILELTTAMVLLVGAGLLGKSFYRLLQVGAGFETNHLITMSVSAPRSRYEGQSVALGRKVVDQIKSLPGVKSIALASTLPLTFNGNTTWIRFVGRAYNGEHNEVNERNVSSDYFQTLQARLLRGRTFTDSEDLTKPLVVVINQALAKKYFPGEDPIGQRIGDTSLSSGSIREIIGIVDDIREGPLDSDIWPAIYKPFNQYPDSDFELVVRTAPTEQSLIPTVNDAIRGIDARIEYFESDNDDGESQQRSHSLLAPFFHVARRRIRGGGVAARRCWTVRSDCLLRESTYSRDRSPHRTRRTTQYCLSTYLERSRCVGTCRDCDRDRMCDSRRLTHAQTALRHAAMGYYNACLCGCCAGGIGVTGELPSRAPRGLSGSDVCLARGVKELDPITNKKSITGNNSSTHPPSFTIHPGDVRLIAGPGSAP